MSFWADAESGKEKEFNHYYLMNLLTMPLGKVFEARISLEAIGLLRTFCKQDGQDRTFLRVATAYGCEIFFRRSTFIHFSFSKIGEQPYRNLRERFAVDD